jgi:hypothetical protein
VIVLEAISSSPGSANVVTLVVITECMELRNESFKSSKELNGVE